MIDMLSDKAKKGAIAGMLAGLVAVAASVALTAASPAPAPEEPARPTVAKAVVETKSATVEEREEVVEPEGAVPASPAGQDVSAASDDPPDLPGDPYSEEQGNPEPNDAQDGAPKPEDPPEGKRDADLPRDDSAKERRWVPDYETVWVPSVETVVDVPEHEEPVYETRDVLVCNVSGCGFSTEASADMTAHWRQHALQGVDEGYSSVPRRVQIGAVTVPAETHEVDNGHYERREAGGHWE